VAGAEPVLCDASPRPAGTLRGAAPGEAIVLTSPDLPEPILLAADDAGVATVSWTCEPDAAGTAALTATGEGGRPPATFPVTGVSEPGAPGMAEISAQARVDQAADAVLDAVDSVRARETDRGFAGVVVTPDAGLVELYWKGTPPQAVADAVEDAATTADVRVTVRPADHTRRELLHLARSLVIEDRVPEDLAVYADLIHRVAIPPEGDAIEIGIAPPARLEDADIALWSLQAERAIETVLEVPVDLVVDAAPAAMSRRDDASPWRGGAAIVGDGTCSTGFGVRRTGMRTAAPHGLLTAAHCRGDARGEYRTGDRSEVVGPERGRHPRPVDSRVIPVERAAASVYSGGVGGAAEFTRPVRGAGRSVVGDAVCTSGAATGAHCGLVVVSVDSYIRPAGVSSFTRVVEAASVVPRGNRGDVAAGQGDSGGPVFTLAADGGVEARGTIVGGSRVVPCAHRRAATCTANVFFADIGTVLEQHRADLLTTDDRP
jgi:hypothetical protein